MSAKDEVVQHYVDQDSLVTIDRDPGRWTTGNGLMHLGFFTCLLAGSDELTAADVVRFNSAVRGCQVAPGLYDRNPGRPDADSHDDANGVVSGSVVCGLPFHRDVLLYGLKHFFFYDNTDQTFDGWKDLWALRLRFPFVVLWYFLVNSWMRPLLPLMLTFLSLSLVFSSAADSRVEDYCKVESLALVYPRLKGFRNWWLRHSKLEMSAATYFNQPNLPEHPLVQLVRELKELK